MFGKKSRPKLHDWRIEEVVLENGKTYYKAQEYDYNYYDQKGWMTMLTAAMFTDAKAFVEEKTGHRVASRRVVWP